MCHVDEVVGALIGFGGVIVGGLLTALLETVRERGRNRREDTKSRRVAIHYLLVLRGQLFFIELITRGKEMLFERMRVVIPQVTEQEIAETARSVYDQLGWSKAVEATQFDEAVHRIAEIDSVLSVELANTLRLLPIAQHARALVPDGAPSGNLDSKTLRANRASLDREILRLAKKVGREEEERVQKHLDDAAEIDEGFKPVLEFIDKIVGLIELEQAARAASRTGSNLSPDVVASSELAADEVDAEGAEKTNKS